MVSDILPQADIRSQLLEHKEELYKTCLAAKDRMLRGSAHEQLDNLLTLYTGATFEREYEIGERVTQLFESVIAHNDVRRFGYLFAEGSDAMRKRGKLEHTDEQEILTEVKSAKEEFLDCFREKEYDHCATLLSKMHTAEQAAYDCSFSNGRIIQQEINDLYQQVDKHDLVAMLLATEGLKPLAEILPRS